MIQPEGIRTVSHGAQLGYRAESTCTDTFDIEMFVPSLSARQALACMAAGRKQHQSVKPNARLSSSRGGAEGVWRT